MDDIIQARTSTLKAKLITLEVDMNEQDLEVLITLDDPWYGPDIDRFHDGPGNSIDNSNAGEDPPLHQYI